MASHDKRATTRYDVEIDMAVRHGDVEVTARTINLSLGGALVRLPDGAKVRVGDQVEIGLAIPGLDKPLSPKAQIRWVDQVGSVVGLQFVTGLRAKETWALGKFLERHKPT